MYISSVYITDYTLASKHKIEIHLIINGTSYIRKTKEQKIKKQPTKMLRLTHIVRLIERQTKNLSLLNYKMIIRILCLV